MALLSKACLLIYHIYVVVVSVYTAKLNVPKVLLPYYSSVATNFTLEVSEGCYIWKSSRPEVASLQMIEEHNGCSGKTVVTAMSKSPHRMTSIVLAEDQVTGQILRCDIIVDVIKSVEVETTTRELYLEDSPEAFSVRALDDEGNTFSSLEGVPFEWSLISDSDTEQENIIDAHNVLRIQTFTESVYETPAAIGIMESLGLQGNQILVHGIKTGSAKVSARLRDPVYKTIKSTVVRLIVVANLVLSPPDVYLLVETQVSYIVELIKQGQTTVISMPSQQYYLSLEKTSIASLDGETSTVTAMQLGDTDIFLKDKNIKVRDAYHQPSASIHVVNPGYLGFVVIPGRKWILETNKEYEILVEIYDRDSHKIYPSHNVRVETKFPNKYFNVFYSTTNGTYHRVQTLTKGFTEIFGELQAIIRQDGTEHIVSPIIKNSQDVEIYDPIQVLPPVLVFPWDPVYKHSYNYPLKAVGGSGDYTWSTTDSHVASVNVRGKITTSDLGATKIVAADVRNLDHTGSMKVHVVPPEYMEFLPSPVEAEIGRYLELPLAMHAMIDGKRQNLVDCRKVPLNITISDKSVFENAQETLPLEDGSCRKIKVNALKLGHATIQASYEYGELKLETRVTVAAYRPLKAIDPETIAVVTVGSSKDIIFDGGPQPWIVDPSTYYRNLVAKNPAILTMNQRATSGQRSLHSFHVLCRDLGEQNIELTVGNKETSTNSFPAVASTHIRFACATPVSLQLQPIMRQPQNLPPCPITPDSGEPIPCYSYKDLDILVTVMDSSGRKFDNFSSLHFHWDVSNKALADFNDSFGLATSETVSDTGLKDIKYYKTLEMFNKLGSLRVTATVNRYDKELYFTSQGILFDESVNPPLEGTLLLMLVEDARISPDQLSIFNHPSNKETLVISKGSGHFHVDTHDSLVANVAYSSSKHTVEVSPLEDGSLTITVQDLCLESSSMAQAHITISGVHIVDVQVLDKVEVKKDIKAFVQVLDNKGKPQSVSYFDLMDLKPNTGSEIISIRKDPVGNPDQFTASYIVHGLSLGTTSLTFVASQFSGLTISSDPKDIQVFPPLRLEPRNITLIIGEVFQLTAYGGPQPQSSIEYSIGDDDITLISHSGLLDSRQLGSTVVTGRAVGVDSITGQQVVYSQDQVNVHVVMLSGIRIYAPLTRLETGTKMPVYAMGLDEHQTPFTFGNAVAPLSFYWSITSKEVVELSSVYHKCGINMPDVNNFAARLSANKQGQVTVRLRAEIAEGSKLQVIEGAVLLDEVQIQVFEKLQLTSPAIEKHTMIITPNTASAIKTNRDGSAKMTYQVSSYKSGVRPLVSVTDSGLVVSHKQTGLATVIVTAHEDFGVNQTVVVLVKVKPISYLMLNLDTEMHTRGHSIAHVPLGATLQFTISYHDDVGAVFHATNTRLKYRPHRFDLLQVSRGQINNTLVIRATDVGFTILKAWDYSNPRIADYITISVGTAIEPHHATVTLGDVICFSSPLVTPSGQQGDWSSSNDVIDMTAGNEIGIASHIGTSVVTYHISGEISTYSEIIVSAITRIAIKQESLQYLTNVPSKKSKAVPVTLGGRDYTETNLRGNNCSEVIQSAGVVVSRYPFKCVLSLSESIPSVQVTHLFSVLPAYDSHSGQYQCVISQKEHSANQDLSSLDVYMQLHAEVPMYEDKPIIMSQVLTVPFLPAFNIQTSEIHLSNVLPQSSVRISTSHQLKQDFKAISSDSSVLEVSNPEPDNQHSNTLHVPVRLLEKAALWDWESHGVHIEIVCSRTGQKMKVPVRVKLVSKADSSTGVSQIDIDGDIAGWGQVFHVLTSNYQTWLFVMFCVGATLSALFIAYHAVMGPRYQSANAQNAAFLQQQALVPSPYTTYSHSPSGFTKPSPYRSPYTPAGGSPSNVHLWTGYSPQEAPDSLHRRSPQTRSSSFH